ncbi:MAG: amino acid adenylation domain-containing protein, partial [Bacteroidota bacterium]
SQSAIVGMLGILKCGAAFIPIDPEYPEARKNYMIEDSGIKHLLKVSDNEYCQSGVNVVNINGIDFVEDSELAVSLNDGELPAYVIYTSGTTGKPKGVVLSQNALLDYSVTFGSYFNMTEEDVVLQQSSLSFDISIEEIFTTFLASATLIIAGNNKAEEIKRHLISSNVTILSATPILIKDLNRNADSLKNLRCLISGGDFLKANYIDNLFGQVDIYNTYGPTEITVCATYNKIESFEDLNIIGKPIANKELFILDANLNQVPLGVQGELYIGGKGVAEGYINNPELTFSKFIDGGALTNSNLYKTGDLAFWRKDGRIQLLGRDDSQLKIRGYRVELDEIENALIAHSRVQEVAVIGKENQHGVKYLKCYFCGDKELTNKELSSFLSQKLPMYMIPAQYTHMSSMPLTATNKIDRSKLLSHQDDNNIAKSDKVLTAQEREVKTIWEEILGVNNIGINDNFFEIGGHSLTAMQIIASCHKQFDVQLTIEDIFLNPSVREISEVIVNKASSEYIKIEKVTETSYYELSQGQMRIWVLEQYDDSSFAYNMPAVFEVSGNLDIDLLELAFNSLIDKHEVLRTQFEVIEGKPKQVIKDLCDIDFKLNSAICTSSELNNLLKEETKKPFDLKKSPLLRAKIFKTEDQQFLAVNIHHIICDGWSVEILIKDLVSIYNGLFDGVKEEFAPESIQYKDFAYWQAENLSSSVSTESKQYWLDQFSSGVPVLNLPTDFVRPSIKRYEGKQATFELGKDLTSKIKSYARYENVSLFNCLVAIVKCMLWKYTGQNDIVVGIPTAGRTHPDVADTVGYFVNTLPIRTELSEKSNFAKLLDTISKNLANGNDSYSNP